MRVNMASCVGYALLLVLTSRSERWGGACVRPQCRVWLAFVAVTYFGSSMGYFMFASTDISAVARSGSDRWRTCVHAHRLRTGPIRDVCTRARYWLDHPWLGAATLSTPTRAMPSVCLTASLRAQPASSVQPIRPRTLRGQARQTRESVGHPVLGQRCGEVESRPVMPLPLLHREHRPRASTRGAPMGEHRDLVALGGVRLIRYAELEIHELIGSGGFSEVFERWVRETSTDSAQHIEAASLRCLQTRTVRSCAMPRSRRHIKWR